jgi:hypothetical protein
VTLNRLLVLHGDAQEIGHWITSLKRGPLRTDKDHQELIDFIQFFRR